MTEGQTNYVGYLLPVFESGSRISEAKLTCKSLRNGSAECTDHVWPPVEQMTSRMGARAETGSRNMAVLAKIESLTPTSYSSPTACMDLFPAVWPQTNYFRFLLPVFKTGSRISEAKLTSNSHRNESTERMKLVRPPVQLNYRSDGR